MPVSPRAQWAVRADRADRAGDALAVRAGGMSAVMGASGISRQWNSSELTLSGLDSNPPLLISEVTRCRSLAFSVLG